MNQMNSNQVCNEHKEIYIAIEFNLDSQQDYIQMCSVCLTQRMVQRITQVSPLGKVLTLNDAYQQIEQIKEEFRQSQTIKVNKIKNVLNELKNEIQGIQTKVKQTCDKLLENIEQISEKASQSLINLALQLKELQILSPTELTNQLRTMEQEFNYTKQTQLFNNWIDQLIIDDQLDKCHNMLKYKDSDEDKILNSVYQKFQLKQDKAHRTPHLSLVCEEHQTEIIWLDLQKDSKRENRLCCLYCQFNSQTQFIPLKNVFERWEAYVKDVHDAMNQINSFYGNKHSTIILYFDKYISYLNETKLLFQETFNKYLQMVIGQKVENYRQQNQIKNCECLSKDDVNQICSKLIHQYTSQQIKQMILDDFAEIDNEIIIFLRDQILVPMIENAGKVIENLSNNTTQLDETKKLIASCEEQHKYYNQNEGITQRISCQISNLKSVQTQTAIQQTLVLQLEEKEDCWCLLFDKDETILVTCHDSKKIKIYKFFENKLQLFQVLNSQTSALFAIQIHNTTKSIITSDNNTIILWNYEQEKKQWVQGQILKEHDDFINCLISNKEETMLISGGNDCKINYWSIQEDNPIVWKLQGSIDVHKSKILSLSLNEKQDFLISSEYDKKLAVCKWEQNKQWLLYQVIILNSHSQRVAFIKNNLFVVQQEDGVFITFKQSKQNSEFLLYQSIKISEQQRCQYWFPLIYNNNNQLLLNKHNNSIYLMREYNNNFSLELTLIYQDQNFWGTLSNSSQYLATWDQNTKQLQIIKLI